MALKKASDSVKEVLYIILVQFGVPMKVVKVMEMRSKFKVQ
jgi:hypothetical protein